MRAAMASLACRTGSRFLPPFGRGPGDISWNPAKTKPAASVQRPKGAEAATYRERVSMGVQRSETRKPVGYPRQSKRGFASSSQGGCLRFPLFPGKGGDTCLNVNDTPKFDHDTRRMPGDTRQNEDDTSILGGDTKCQNLRFMTLFSIN